MRVILVVHRGEEMLCRPSERSAVPEVGQAFTTGDEGDVPEYATRVEAVVSGRRTPLVYGGDWPYEPNDPKLRKSGFRPCSSRERALVEGEIGE